MRLKSRMTVVGAVGLPIGLARVRIPAFRGRCGYRGRSVRLKGDCIIAMDGLVAETATSCRTPQPLRVTRACRVSFRSESVLPGRHRNHREQTSRGSLGSGSFVCRPDVQQWRGRSRSHSRSTGGRCSPSPAPNGLAECASSVERLTEVLDVL